nr:zinc finger, CCHC-type [Tanacetum cinerariifolium]
MENKNPIRTLRDYSKPSHEGYRNTIELPVGNNVVPLRSDTIRWCKMDALSTDFVALDKALVPSNKSLRIGRSNFRLPLDIQSKESTLQVVYDVLRISPFFKAFLVMADVPEIYMQEF